MPIYGYACTSCGHTLDELQKIADDPLVDCPACEKSSLKRQLSAPRFRLKGKGWYETDFKSDNQRNLASDGKPVAANGASGDAKAADTKADTATPKADPKKADTKTAEPKKAEVKKDSTASKNKENTA